VAILKKTGQIQVDKRRTERWLRKQNKKTNKKFNIPKLDKLHFSLKKDFTFLSDSDLQNKAVVKSLEYVGLDISTDNMYTVNNGSNIVHLVSQTLKSISHSGNSKLNVASTPGVGILSSNGMSCSFRNPFCMKGSLNHLFSNSVKKRIVTGTQEDTSLLLNNNLVDPLSIVHLSDETQEMLKSMESGWFTYKFQTEKIALQCPGYTSGNKVFLRLNDRRRNHFICLLRL